MPKILWRNGKQIPEFLIFVLIMDNFMKQKQNIIHVTHPSPTKPRKYLNPVSSAFSS